MNCHCEAKVKRRPEPVSFCAQRATTVDISTVAQQLTTCHPRIILIVLLCNCDEQQDKRDDDVDVDKVSTRNWMDAQSRHTHLAQSLRRRGPRRCSVIKAVEKLAATTTGEVISHIAHYTQHAAAVTNRIKSNIYKQSQTIRIRRRAAQHEGGD